MGNLFNLGISALNYITNKGDLFAEFLAGHEYIVCVMKMIPRKRGISSGKHLRNYVKN